MPLVQSAGIAQVGNTAGAKSLRDPHVPNIFHLRASTGDEIEAAVSHAWTVGVTRIGAAYQDDAYGKEALEALAGAIKKRGGTAVAVAPVPRGTVDVAAAAQKMAEAKPQAVFFLGQSKPAAAFIKAVRAKGTSPQFFVPSVASGLYGDLGEASAGVIVSQVMPYPFSELGNPVVREYQAVLAKAPEKSFSYNSLEGFLNAKLIARALTKTSPPITRSRIISTLENFTSEDLGGFAVTYTKASNLGSHFVALTMIRKDGSFAR